MHPAFDQAELRPPKRTYSILIADDHAIVRIGLKVMIRNIDSSIQVEEAANGDEVIGKLKVRPFDLLILDINMPNTESFSLSGYLTREFPLMKILIFTINDEYTFAMRFLRLGVHGYLLKQTSEGEMQNAIRKIMDGQVYISDSISAVISGQLVSPKTNNPFELLSDREFEVTLQILKGYSVANIAATLHLNKSTVGTHRCRVMKKLGVTNTVGLIELAKKHKII
jgi:two-component system invasion response regulator UvrY